MRTTSKNFELVSSSRRSTPVTSRWVTSLTLDLLKGCRMTLCADSISSKSVPNGVQGDHLASTCLWRPLPRLTWLPAINWRRSRTRQNRWQTPRVLQFRDICLRWFRQLGLQQCYLQILCQHRTSILCRLQLQLQCLRLRQSPRISTHWPSFGKSCTPTLTNLGTIGSMVKIVEKLGIATTVASKGTWPATVRRIDHHLEEENVEGQDQARLEAI